MRNKLSNDQLTVLGVAGTHVVLHGMSFPKAKAQGLRGFGIMRTDHATGEILWMRGVKTFEGIGDLPSPGIQVSSQEHPFQGFQWADYSSKLGQRYTYRVLAMSGIPGALKEAETVELEVTTEAETGQRHEIHFNRGVAGSQEYTRRFQDQSPDKVGPAAFQWLSRGLIEALVRFIEQAEDSRDEIVGVIYEFQNQEVMAALKAAKARGATVRMLYGADDPKTRTPNEAAIKKAGIKGLCQPRANGPGIPHNKFFVWSRDGERQAVWTGPTNLTQNGIFGHSNVGHVVRIGSVAGLFHDYWDLLFGDPDGGTTRDWTNTATPSPVAGWTPTTQVIFSPRAYPAKGNGNALNYFADLARQAKQGLFMTFALGIHQKLLDVFTQADTTLRFALMENLGQKAADRAAVTAMRRLPNAMVAVGNRLQANEFDRWLEEKAKVIENTHVEYIHTKYMLVDPLSDAPLVISGSANFSKASIDSNDENMLLINRDTRVADIHLGEFIRLYSHHSLREFLVRKKSATDLKFRHLDPTDAWTKDYYEDNATARQVRRKYFAGL